MPDVLVVEDEFALCEFLTHVLRREMLPFRLAQSGREALDLAAELWPSVVLLKARRAASLINSGEPGARLPIP